MSTFSGEERAAEGIAHASDAEEPLSLNQARDALFVCTLLNEFLDADTVHRHLEDAGLPDLERSGAWGGLWRLALREGWIEKVADSARWRKSGRTSLHAKPMQLYHSRMFGEFP